MSSLKTLPNFIRFGKVSLKLTDINNEKYFVFNGAKVQQDKKNVKDNFLGLIYDSLLSVGVFVEGSEVDIRKIAV